MRSTVWTCALLYVSMVAIAQAENWGHWRGPTGNGSTLQAKPPLQWSSQKNVRWKVELPGLGSSSPIVWNQQVFVTTAVPVNKSSKDKMTELEFKLLCFDRPTASCSGRKRPWLPSHTKRLTQPMDLLLPLRAPMANTSMPHSAHAVSFATR